jgi:hypothetical protein
VKKAIEHSTAALELKIRPALLQGPENSPEEAAVHQAGHATASAGSERERLGIFEVVGDLVKESVEQLFQGAPALVAIV